MIKKVIKRDKTEQPFSLKKLKAAIKASFVDISDKCTKDEMKDISAIAHEINDEMSGNVDVEAIQDAVEKKLMEKGYYDQAKQYILYRDEHARLREQHSKLMKTISSKLSGKNVVNQNANLDEKSFGGRKGEADSALMKEYALNYCMSDMSRSNHLNNEIYIHDLDSYSVGMHNCLSIPFDDLLAKGFNTRQTDIRPAGSISTALQLIAVIFQLQSLQQFGGVSATHLDWTLVPYVRKSFYKHYKDGIEFINDNANDDVSCDLPIESEKYTRGSVYDYAIKMTERELKQSVEGMYHNLNTLQSRSGNQLPFTSINYGTCTLTEGRMVIKALLEGSLDGVGKVHRTPIFPCGIFQCMRGVNRAPGDPNYDLFQLALKSTAKRLYPNYANVDWSGNEGYDRNDPKTYFSTMGKRKL